MSWGHFSLNAAAAKKTEDAILAKFVAHDNEHALIEQARDKAEENMNKRLEGMNEFRHQIDKQSENFATKKELEDSIRPISDFQKSFWGFMAGIAVVNCIITILISMLMRK